MGQRLGQHFLTNPHYARELVRGAGITADDTVLEIGPGEGMLTRELLAAAKRVIAVEKDEALAARLHELFPVETSRSNLEVITGDIRDFEPSRSNLDAGGYVLAANIPYYITGEIIRRFLETNTPPKTMALLVQKEVAQRIVSNKESILSISVKAYGTPKIAAKVSRGNFNPPPNVDSAILVISNISKKNFTDVDEKKFFEVVRAGFASKRKLLANNLGVVFGKDVAAHALNACNIDPRARAETLHVQEWLQLAAHLLQ